MPQGRKPAWLLSFKITENAAQIVKNVLHFQYILIFLRAYDTIYDEVICMYNILIVDDEDMIRKLIRKYAEFDGHSVTEATDGMDAVIKFQRDSFDIIVMDIMMPELDGFSASRKIRETSSVPIIMLSARGEEYDKINGFEIGIDDYVVKPFSPKELMLRIEAIMKRSKSREKKDESKNEIVSLANGGLVADLTARIVYIDGERIDMSPKEYELFFYMLKNKNIALSRDKLLSDVWGYDFFGDDRTLDTHIKILRKSLGKYSDFIVTIRGMGYRFEEK